MPPDPLPSESAKVNFGLLYTGILLLVLAGAAYLLKSEIFQDNAGFFVVKVFLSLGGGLVASQIPGTVGIEVNSGIKATGALAIVILIFFNAPPIDSSTALKRKDYSGETCNEQKVKMLYAQMLEETPDETQLKDGADALESKNSTVKDLVRKLAHSDTFKRKFLSSGTSAGIDQIFYRLLGNHSYLKPDHPAIKVAQEIGWDAYIDGVIDDPGQEYVQKWGNDKIPRDLHSPAPPTLPCK